MHNNYFTCTLGQARIGNNDKRPYDTIGQFLSYQGQHHGELPAVGFPIPSRDGGNWGSKILTFREIDQGTQAFAEKLIDCCGPAIQHKQTVALLADSSAEFLFVWLALVKLGCSVLLIAPQCQASAIAHLCKACQVALLFHDDTHSNRAAETESLLAKDSIDFAAKCIPMGKHEDVFQIIQQRPKSKLDLPRLDETAIAYLHHTSGTSSGLPKPIPQSHRAGLGVLPCLPEDPSKATFTTTPLYHGGIADLFRAWTSNALIWLFPGNHVPITARNICHCLEVADECSSNGRSPAVKYFSSVPYVLQMMEADEQGLALLKSMDIVGVGGAALPAEVGKRLVKQGVHLISRFGSAECGFLLSSYRDFEKDDEWQYLRDYNPANLLSFEERDGGLSELVIKPGWPHMAKTNRPDGSFATADLFAPHPSIKNAWLYHSRADSQLTLITGKKFDPAPLESAIATAPQLDDVLIFGDSRPFPGALLLRSQDGKNLTDDELLSQIRPIVEKLNADTESHAQIPLNMLIPIPHQSQPLEKSSKGTIIRRAAEARFKDDIDRAYHRLEINDDAFVEDNDLPVHLMDLIRAIKMTDEPLNEDTELFAYGMDSIASMQLRYRLQHLVKGSGRELPLSIVEDCGTVRRLTEYIVQIRRGATNVEGEDEEQLMLDFVEKYSDFSNVSPASASPCLQGQENGHHEKERDEGEVVLLTGATGALGAHLLHLLRQSPRIAHIYCLVRGADPHAAFSRVDKALSSKGLPDLSPTSPSSKLNTKISILPATLSAPDLGLPKDLYNELVQKTTVVLHIAWTVNFRLKLRSFEKDNIAGLYHLLLLTLQSSHPRGSPKFKYCSSTAAAMSYSSSPSIPELVLEDPKSSSPLGYSRSKWVAERICSVADQHDKMKGKVSVVRVGQLGGDTERGIWNQMEAWPMMLSTAALTGCLPDLRGEVLDWLPVDGAAGAFVQVALLDSDKMESGEGGEEDGECSVYHVLNEHGTPSWRDMLGWLQDKEKREGREVFEIVEPAEWVRRLEREEGSEHPSLKLLGLWKEAYGDKTEEVTEDSEDMGGMKRPKWDMHKTKKDIEVMRDVKPVDEAYVGKIWDWVRKNVR